MADGEQQAKRARTGLAGGWQEAASQAAATLPGSPAAAVLDEEELEGSDSELKERIELLPCDTLVAMQVMENECRQQAPQFPWPVVLKSHLYSLVKDHAAVDKEIDDMRRRRVVRVFKVPIATDDYAVQLTEHYEKHVREVKHTLIEGGTPAETAAALDWFIDRVLPRWVEVSISHNDFVELLARPRHRSSSREAGGAGEVSEEHVSLLLKSGCISRQHRLTSGEAYWFAIPGAGPILQDLEGGRKEIIALLKKRRCGEMLERELLKKKLRGSGLGVPLHLKDLLGLGIVKSVPTTSGPLL
eukprot:CAMPEP_0117676390 /NCGR_PEP_ID=MMETSP0804-20121206/16146_1 /TAXON_ID=1074897 /ORGANISM="Tetraselmis astigmatica, Strain CCMP880" /LENGTH=300 /DNA_ID=CAMNT_0005485523 /DNA_START=164 /DNA_END=1063 /DNA_ORIENTATION=-